MRVYHEEGESIREFEGPPRIQVYGGEYILDDGLDISGYGISLEDAYTDASISDIPPETAVRLAEMLVNHLMVNRHVFEIQGPVWDQTFKHVETP